MEREFMPPSELKEKARTNSTFLGSSFIFLAQINRIITLKPLKHKNSNILKPNSGLKKLNVIWQQTCFWIIIQVQTFWQWFDYLCEQARHDGKEICLINIDETSIHRCALRSKGYVTKKTNMGRPPARFINRSLKRGTATHVAAISHLPQIQALLPQFVLLNKRTFREKDIPDNVPPGLRFIRDI